MNPIVTPPVSPQPFYGSLQLTALENLLPDAEVEAVCRGLGHTWRHRQLPPGPTVRSMVFRGLNPDHSIAAVLASLAALEDPGTPASTDAAWCQARTRLPEEALVELTHRRAVECQERFGANHRWQGRWVFRVDGSTVSMPDTPSLARCFGRSRNQNGRSRFPVARVTFIELAGPNVVWDYRMGRYRLSEEHQFHEMRDTLPEGCICLLDAKFCSFYTLAKLSQRRIDAVTPLNGSRDAKRLIAQGRPLGPNQWHVELRLQPHLRKKYHDSTLPQTLPVRLLRVRRRRKTLWLVTTLLDPATYSAAQVTRLYRTRWEIETRIGDLKTTLEMNVLRSKGPQAARREVGAIILGYNLTWMFIHEAAAATKTPVKRISFAGAAKTVLAFSAPLLYATGERRQSLYNKMLFHIARQTNHHPPGRVEPRRIKRCLVRYPYLREPRWKAREK